MTSLSAWLPMVLPPLIGLLALACLLVNLIALRRRRHWYRILLAVILIGGLTMAIVSRDTIDQDMTPAFPLGIALALLGSLATLAGLAWTWLRAAIAARLGG